MVELSQVITSIYGISILSVLISSLAIWIVVRISLVKAFIASLIIQVIETLEKIFLPSLTANISTTIAGSIGGFFLRPIVGWILATFIAIFIIKSILKLSFRQTIMIFVVKFILGIIFRYIF